jgi:uncharacterized protein (TIGR02453 family)
MSELSRFERFADTSGRFFAELALHNDRGWFQAHRDEYEDGWRAPLTALLLELRERLSRTYAGIVLAAPRIFRIHRDVRFSRDKTPYKTSIGGCVALAGRPTRAVEPPAAIYFHVGFEEVSSGAGLYAMEPDVLKRHRAAVLDRRRGAEIERIVADLRRKGFSLSAHDRTKRVPAGVDPEHPRAELLKMKGLAAMAPPLDRRLLASRDLVDRLVADARAAAPLVHWLVDHAY